MNVMTTYAATFARMRRLAGSPRLVCVKPRAQWSSVPSGYTFDASYDAFLDSSGAVWKPTTSSDLSASDYVTVPFLPVGGSMAQALAAGGLVDEGTRYGHILTGDAVTVQVAQWLEIDGYAYNLAECTATPAGAPQWYVLRLTKR